MAKMHASHSVAAAHAHHLRARPTVALPCRCKVGHTADPVSLAEWCIWHAVQLLGNIGRTPSTIVCSHLWHFKGHHGGCEKEARLLKLSRCNGNCGCCLT
jgi:hypothetical protein